jgi:hypothetical protein
MEMKAVIDTSDSNNKGYEQHLPQDNIYGYKSSSEISNPAEVHKNLLSACTKLLTQQHLLTKSIDHLESMKIFIPNLRQGGRFESFELPSDFNKMLTEKAKEYINYEIAELKSKINQLNADNKQLFRDQMTKQQQLIATLTNPSNKMTDKNDFKPEIVISSEQTQQLIEKLKTNQTPKTLKLNDLTIADSDVIALTEAFMLNTSTEIVLFEELDTSTLDLIMRSISLNTTIKFIGFSKISITAPLVVQLPKNVSILQLQNITHDFAINLSELKNTFVTKLVLSDMPLEAMETLFKYCNDNPSINSLVLNSNESELIAAFERFDFRTSILKISCIPTTNASEEIYQDIRNYNNQPNFPEITAAAMSNFEENSKKRKAEAEQEERTNKKSKTELSEKYDHELLLGAMENNINEVKQEFRDTEANFYQYVNKLMVIPVESNILEAPTQRTPFWLSETIIPGGADFSSLDPEIPNKPENPDFPVSKK